MVYKYFFREGGSPGTSLSRILPLTRHDPLNHLQKPKFYPQTPTISNWRLKQENYQNRSTTTNFLTIHSVADTEQSSVGDLEGVGTGRKKVHSLFDILKPYPSIIH